jgi:hypothetical protein
VSEDEIVLRNLVALLVHQQGDSVILDLTKWPDLDSSDFLFQLRIESGEDDTLALTTWEIPAEPLGARIGEARGLLQMKSPESDRPPYWASQRALWLLSEGADGAPHWEELHVPTTTEESDHDDS